MRTTKKKAAAKKAAQPTQPKPRTIEARFDDLVEAYGTEDAEVIKQKIMFKNIALLVDHLLQPGSKQYLPYDRANFDLCNAYIEHEGNVYCALMSSREERLKSINAMVIEMHKLFGDDHKDNCRRLLPERDTQRLDYAMLFESLNKIYGHIV